MGEATGNVRAYSDGHVWTALLNSAVPSDPTTALVAPFYEVGLLSDKGLVEAHSIQEKKIYAYQNAQLVRVMRSQEERTWDFEALEENAMVRRLLYPTASITSGAGTNEQQTVTINGSPTGGTFKLSFEGAVTSAIAFGAVASAVQTALQALATIGAGGATVAGSGGGPFTVTFAGALAAQNIAQLVADGSALTGGTSPSVAIATSVPGVLPVTTTIVQPNTQQNMRAWVIDLLDGIYIRRTVINRGEAVDSGNRSYTSTDAVLAAFTLTAYADNNGTTWTEYSNNPALAVPVF